MLKNTSIRCCVKTFLLKIIEACVPNRLILLRGKKQEKVLYLTFDDGPDEVYTKKIIKILKDNGAVATFFLIGDKIIKNIDLVASILENGGEIGNHSYKHNKFYSLPLAQQLLEVTQTDKILKKIDCERSYYFRAPQGRINPILLMLLLIKRIGYAYWSYDSMDYKYTDYKKVVEMFECKKVKDGDIILFHDDNICTVEAITELLPIWKSNGFKFRTLGN